MSRTPPAEAPVWFVPPPSELLVLLQYTAPGHSKAWKYLANLRSWLETAWGQQQMEWLARHPEPQPKDPPPMAQAPIVGSTYEACTEASYYKQNMTLPPLFPDCYRLAWDWETHPIGPGNVVPPGICVSFAFDGGDVEPTASGIVSTGGPKDLDDILNNTILPLDPAQEPCGSTPTGTRKIQRVAHNAAFDLAVSARRNPDLIPAIFRLLEEGKIHCTMIREMLLNLVDGGEIDFYDNDMGFTSKALYDLNSLVVRYGGPNKQHLKEGDDIWRLHYSQLDGKPVDEWPDEAKRYSLDDAYDALFVHLYQEERRRQIIKDKGVDPFATQDFRVFAHFCLLLMTAWGARTDPEEKAKVEAFLAVELDDSKMQGLLATGILRPAKPSRPYANGAKNLDGTPKMTAAEESSINKKAFTAYVLKLAEEDDELKLGLKYTDPTEKFPEGQLQLDAAFLEEFGDSDPVLAEYKHRQSLQKLVTTELPRMCWEGKTAPIVHPNYRVLKKTGRTSSFASDTYPSFNCQNVHPRVRGCFIPREGYDFFSVDFSQMELGTLGQTCLELFGHSVIADKINNGEDLHGFLGAQIAFASHEGFNVFCQENKASSSDERAKLFVAFKKSEEGSDERNFYEHFRKLAKPTGLGYPGGLGAKKFITYAKATYGVEIDLDTAKLLRQVWLDTFPEMSEYFDYINNKLIDPHHAPQTKTDKKTGREYRSNKYAYMSPFGLWRPNADYCATANGRGLQTPSAEGAIMACCNVVRACYDYTQASILYGGVVRPIFFIHDEIVGEIAKDDQQHERVKEIQRIMEASMSIITPNVKVRTEACLMSRWDKKAKPVFDANGRLTVWHPKEK